MKENKIIKGALIISLGGFLTKLIGAFYRIPLTRILGAKGIGLYQMAFPLYCLLLTFSSQGVPNGIAKLIASGEDAQKTLKSALKLFVPFGFLLTLIMAIFSSKIATLQGNVMAKGCYLFLSPSIFLVSVISCFRGYFQGLSNMLPTSISQILEQVVKCVFGLILCYIFRKNLILATNMAVLAVTFSEIIATLYFIILYNKKSKFNLFKSAKTNVKKVRVVVVPIMLATITLPLCRTVESFMIVNILKGYLQNATSLYGIYSGGVESVVGVPVAICYGLCVSSIPEIAKRINVIKKVKLTVFLTLASGLLFAVTLYFFSPIIVKVLYSSLLDNEKIIMIKMLKIASLSVFFLSLMQTSSAVLIALSKTKITLINGILSAVLKLILSYFLLKIPSINVFACIFTDIFSYFVACFLNLVYIVIVLKKSKGKSYEQNNFSRVRNR